MTSRDMERVIRYMQDSTVAQFDKQTQVGERVPANPAAGRQSGYWLHGADTAAGERIVVDIHGGGFALGDARRGDALREWVSKSYDVVAAGLDYRKTPEHPAPAALEDVVASLRDLSARFEDAGGHLPELYLLGFSAGGNLALAAALQLLDDPRVRIGGLVLHYPMVDAHEVPVNDGNPAALPFDLVMTFTEWYVCDIGDTDPRVSPALAPDEQVARLPRTVVYPVVGDALYGQAVRLAERMASLGCDVAVHPVEGIYHGYIEDAENVEAYEALTMPKTIASRPANYVQVADEELRASLTELLGPAVRDVSFPGTEKGGRA